MNAVKPVVLYDGRCRICTAGADRIRRLDTLGRFEILSLHEPEVAARFPEIRKEDVLAEMHVVKPDGSIAKGHAAVREVLHELPRWKWLSLAWLIPSFPFFADRGYKWVARNRYRWNKQTCEGDVCRLHG